MRGDTFPPIPLYQDLYSWHRGNYIQTLKASCQLPYITRESVQLTGSTIDSRELHREVLLYLHR
jgi:hypothetical protein